MKSFDMLPGSPAACGPASRPLFRGAAGGRIPRAARARRVKPPVPAGREGVDIPGNSGNNGHGFGGNAMKKAFYVAPSGRDFKAYMEGTLKKK
jgi:hypothetical protein